MIRYFSKNAAGLAKVETSPATTEPVTAQAQQVGVKAQGWARVWQSGPGYYGLAFLGALLLAIIYTWPVILNPAQTVPGHFAADQAQNTWSLWWVKHSLLDGARNPFKTDYLFYPTGASLYLYALNPLGGLLALPVTALAGPVAAFSLTCIFGLALTGLAATALCYNLSQHRLGGLVAGYALTFSVIHFSYVGLGQLEFIALWPFLLYLTGLTKLLYRLPPAGTKWTDSLRMAAGPIVGAVVCLLAASFTTLYYASYAALFTLLLGGFRLVQLRRERGQLLAVVSRVGLAWLGFGALFAPYALKVLHEQNSGRNELDVPYQTIMDQSVAVHSYLTQFDGNSLLGQLLGLGRAAPNNIVHYLGYSLPLLALAGVWLSRGKGGKPWPWLATGLVFATLSFGPAIRWQAEINPPQIDPQPWMPWNWFHATPLLSLTNNPMRCELLLLIALAAGAAVGIRELAGRWQSGPKLARYGLGALIVGLVLESAALPAITRQLDIPPQVSVIKEDCAKIGCGQAAVLDLPFSKDHYLSDATLMLWGAWREKPIMGGYLSRREPDPYDPETSPFRLFRQLSPLQDIFTPGANESALQILNYFNVRYLTVNPREFTRIYAQSPNKLTAFLQNIVGPDAAIYNTTDTQIYRVPPLTADQKHPFVIVGDGFYKVETDPPPAPAKRWAQQQCSLQIYTFQAASAEMTFEATAFAQDRTVNILLNDQPVDKLTMAGGSWKPFTLKLNLKNGLNTLRLEAVEPPTSPAKLDPKSADTRQLAIALRQVKLIS